MDVKLTKRPRKTSRRGRKAARHRAPEAESLGTVTLPLPLQNEAEGEGAPPADAEQPDPGGSSMATQDDSVKQAVDSADEMATSRKRKASESNTTASPREISTTHAAEDFTTELMDGAPSSQSSKRMPTFGKKKKVLGDTRAEIPIDDAAPDAAKSPKILEEIEQQDQTFTTRMPTDAGHVADQKKSDDDDEAGTEPNDGDDQDGNMSIKAVPEGLETELLHEQPLQRSGVDRGYEEAAESPNQEHVVQHVQEPHMDPSEDLPGIPTGDMDAVETTRMNGHGGDIRESCPSHDHPDVGQAGAEDPTPGKDPKKIQDPTPSDSESGVHQIGQPDGTDGTDQKTSELDVEPAEELAHSDFVDQDVQPALKISDDGESSQTTTKPFGSKESQSHAVSAESEEGATARSADPDCPVLLGQKSSTADALTAASSPPIVAVSGTKTTDSMSLGGDKDVEQQQQQQQQQQDQHLPVTGIGSTIPGITQKHTLEDCSPDRPSVPQRVPFTVNLKEQVDALLLVGGCKEEVTPLPLLGSTSADPVGAARDTLDRERGMDGQEVEDGAAAAEQPKDPSWDLLAQCVRELQTVDECSDLTASQICEFDQEMDQMLITYRRDLDSLKKQMFQKPGGKSKT